MFCKWCRSEIPDDAQFCVHCGKDLKPEEEISFVESPTIESSSERDYKLYLDGGFETLFLDQSQRKNIYLIVEKNISSPVYGAKVQLSGPSHVDLIIKSRKLPPKKITNKIFFPISARELGFFTLTATLTSDAGHQIAYSFKIRVEPINFNYVQETRAKPAIQTTQTPTTSEQLATVLTIFGLIGGIMFIGGLIILFGFGYPFNLISMSIGTTLSIIGFIICAITFSIKTKGKCCCELCCHGW